MRVKLVYCTLAQENVKLCFRICYYIHVLCFAMNAALINKLLKYETESISLCVTDVPIFGDKLHVQNVRARVSRTTAAELSKYRYQLACNS